MIAEAGSGEGVAHKGRIRKWVCRAYVHMACRLLGIPNQGTMHGIRYPGQVLKGQGGRGWRYAIQR